MDKTFKTKADFWGMGDVTEITIVKKGEDILVNGWKAKMKYNTLQLRFETEHGIFTVLERHSPPLPIEKLYQELRD